MSDTELTADNAFIALRCPKCGGELGKPTAGKFTCEYCGTTFLPGEVFAGKAVNLQKFYEEAFAALGADNHRRAYEYFNRILETAPREYQAWLGKGMSGAYAGLIENQLFDSAEVLSCVDMALEYYDGEDRAAFETSLADRLGALAIGVFETVKANEVGDEANLGACLELLRVWEEKGTDELAAWKAIVDVAESQSVPPKGKRRPGVTYITFDYPFRSVAAEYSRKIREKYDPAFQNVFERGAETKKEIAKSLKKIGIVAVVVILAMVIIIITVVVILAAFGIVGLSYFA